jgi:hypothetical protein
MMWGLPDWASHDGEHAEEFGCKSHPPCMWIVEQHQMKGTDAPEFVIAVKWQDGDLDKYLDGKSSHAHGWRYVMRWEEGVYKRVVSGYGFPTEQAARQAAEEKATKIVRAQQPEKVYKFTPEV